MPRLSGAALVFVHALILPLSLFFYTLWGLCVSVFDIF